MTYQFRYIFINKHIWYDKLIKRWKNEIKIRCTKILKWNVQYDSENLNIDAQWINIKIRINSFVEVIE